MNIQDEVQKIHNQYGMSEMSNYKIQLLFDSEIEKKSEKTAIDVLEWSRNLKNNEDYSSSELLELFNKNKK